MRLLWAGNPLCLTFDPPFVRVEERWALGNSGLESDGKSFPRLTQFFSGQPRIIDTCQAPSPQLTFMPPRSGATIGLRSRGNATLDCEWRKWDGIHQHRCRCGEGARRDEAWASAQMLSGRCSDEALAPHCFGQN